MKPSRPDHFRLVLLLLFLPLFVLPVQGSRMLLPMGHYISDAELIVVADTAPENARPFGIVLSIREVLKGDMKLVGKTFTIKRNGFSTADAYVPTDTTRIGVLLRPGWEEAKEWPVLEAYRKPEEIEALRILVPICAIRNERERLLAVRGTLAFHNSVCEQQLFAELEETRSASNFPTMTNLYPKLELANQIKLVDLIGRIGDVRGVPILISAAASEDRKLSAGALRALCANFPGAPGVAVACNEALSREHLRREAAIYLAKRDADPKLKAMAQGKETAWGRARHLLESAKTNEARGVYLELVEDEREPYRMRIHAASLLIQEADAKEKERIRQTLLPLLANEGDKDDYILALQLARILRALHHPDCLIALLSITRLTSFTSAEATWTATMAIRELGPQANRAAVAQVVERLKSPTPKSVVGAIPSRYPLELLWLGTQRNFTEAEPLMEAEHARSWKSLRPLEGIGDSKDEAAFLIEQLSQGPSLSGEAPEWVILRLGDLKDKRAIPALIGCLRKPLYWQVRERAADALIKIGGPEVEQELTKSLRDADSNVGRAATEALLTLLGERSLDLSRRILSEKDSGRKVAAYRALGRFGTTNDLKSLTALADFWTGDRTNHYWAMMALHALRERCNYDLIGPIKPAL